MQRQQSHDVGVPQKVYVAARQMKVGDDFRSPGELVPEAVDWLPKVLGIWIKGTWRKSGC